MPEAETTMETTPVTTPDTAPAVTPENSAAGSILGGATEAAPEAATTEAAKATEGEAAKETQPFPEKPEGYKVEFAPETIVDTELLGEFQKWAHQHKIPQESFAAIARQYEARMKASYQQAMQSQQEAWGRTVREWRRQTEADPELAPALPAQMERMRQAVDKFGGPEMKTWLNQTGLGNHPLLVKFVMRVGQALAEPAFVQGAAGGEDRGAAEVIYPNQGR